MSIDKMILPVALLFSLATTSTATANGETVGELAAKLADQINMIKTSLDHHSNDRTDYGAMNARTLVNHIEARLFEPGVHKLHAVLDSDVGRFRNMTLHLSKNKILWVSPAKKLMKLYTEYDKDKVPTSVVITRKNMNKELAPLLNLPQDHEGMKSLLSFVDVTRDSVIRDAQQFLAADSRALQKIQAFKRESKTVRADVSKDFRSRRAQQIKMGAFRYPNRTPGVPNKMPARPR